MESVLFWTATTSYAVATVLSFLWVAFAGGAWGKRWGVTGAGKGDRLEAAFLAVTALGLAVHGASLILRWLAVGHGPYATRYEVVSANTFVLLSVWLLASALGKGLRALGPWVLPIAFLFMGWGLTNMGVQYTLPIIFRSTWLYLHIGFAKLFAATIFLSAGCAGAYLLKERSPDRLPRLPSPERLDLYSHQLMLVSFLFLGVMIIAGSLWAAQGWGRYWGWDPIETSALVTWVVMGLVQHMRVLHGWSGRRMAYLTFVGLLSAIITIYVVALVVPTIHSSYLVGK